MIKISGKRIKTNRTTLDFMRVFRLVFIILQGHSFATRCIENGMEPQVLKVILGHAKLAITMDLYAHVLPDTKVKEMQKISGLFPVKGVS